ncbi:MAG: hypothetical protein HQL32_04065 [Planctomycetes bacterium]|nr:hypothetical protein [Planctomycetota bacterium]
MSIACGGGGGGDSDAAPAESENTNRFKSADAEQYAGTWYATSFLMNNVSYIPTGIREAKMVINQDGSWVTTLRFADVNGVISTNVSTSENNNSDDYSVTSFAYVESDGKIDITQKLIDKSDGSEINGNLTVIRSGIDSSLVGTYTMNTYYANGADYTSYYLSNSITVHSDATVVQNATLAQDGIERISSFSFAAHDGSYYVIEANYESEVGGYSLANDILTLNGSDYEGNEYSVTYLKQ